jgi:hypothetical protein
MHNVVIDYGQEVDRVRHGPPLGVLRPICRDTGLDELGLELGPLADD